MCYLVFSPSSQGSLLSHWSATPVEGALASFAPTKPVPKFKLTQNGGRSELLREVAKPGSKRLYEGVCGFVKMARSFGGSLTLLSQLDGRAVAIYLASKELSIARMEVGGEAIELGDKLAVAVLPEQAIGFGGVQRMETHLFQATGNKLGAANTFA